MENFPLTHSFHTGKSENEVDNQLNHHPWQDTCPCLNPQEASEVPEGKNILRTARDKKGKQDYHSQLWKSCTVIRLKKMPNHSGCSTASHYRRFVPQVPWAWTPSQPPCTTRISPLGPPPFGKKGTVYYNQGNPELKVPSNAEKVAATKWEKRKKEN